MSVSDLLTVIARVALRNLNTDQAVNLLDLELTRLGRKTEGCCKKYSLLLHYYPIQSIFASLSPLSGPDLASSYPAEGSAAELGL